MKNNVNGEMIWSKRNYWVKSNKYDGLLFVGNTSSFLQVDKEYVNEIKMKGFSNLPIELFNELKKIGAIVESDEEVFDRYQFLSMKNNNNISMDFWICISDGCNFNCEYCFEGNKKKNNFISDVTIDNIMKYIVKNKELKILTVSFAGGEPLLSVDKVLVLYQKLNALGIALQLNLITNGYLLSKDVIQKLDTIKNLQYQVTIDGMKDMHNRKRPHKTNADSFSVIINNLDSFYETHKDKTINFQIRINVDKENYCDVAKLYNFLHHRYGNFFGFYLKPVDNYEKKSEKCFTPKEFSDLLVSLYDQNKIYIGNLFPKFRFPGGYCSSNRLCSYVIAANGDVYKCPVDIGEQDKVITNINKKGYYNYKPEEDYMIKASPYYDKSCKECSLFFQCYGGCPHMRLTNQKVCIPAKYNMDRILEIYYENIILQNNKTY